MNFKISTKRTPFEIEGLYFEDPKEFTQVVKKLYYHRNGTIQDLAFYNEFLKLLKKHNFHKKLEGVIDED